MSAPQAPRLTSRELLKPQQTKRILSAPRVLALLSTAQLILTPYFQLQGLQLQKNTPALELFLPATLCAEPLMSYEQRLQQVELYMERKLFVQAVHELKKLIQTQEGMNDYRVAKHLLLASYQLSDITSALHYLRVARNLTTDPQERTWLASTYKTWAKSYGLVRFESIPAGFGAIKLESERVLLNPERRKAFEVTQEQLLKGVSTPISVYLPYGSYLANKTPFALKREVSSQVVQLTLLKANAPPPSPSEARLPWGYITLGALVLIGGAVGGYYLVRSANQEPTYQLFIN